MVRRSIHSVTTATGHAVPASKARQTSHAVRSGLLALEPRLLFDGAIGATADAAGDAGAHDFADAGAVAPTAAPVADTLPSPDEPTIAPKWATEPAPNSAPVANPDLRDVPYDAGQLWGNVITGGAPGDVADYDPDGDAFAVFGVTPGDTQQVPIANVGQPLAGEHGSLVLYDDGSYSYVPDASVAQLAPGESAQDVFSYLVCDIEGNISTTTLTIRYSNDAAPEPTPCPPPAPEPGPGPAPEPGPTPVPGPGPISAACSRSHRCPPLVTRAVVRSTALRCWHPTRRRPQPLGPVTCLHLLRQRRCSAWWKPRQPVTPSWQMPRLHRYPMRKRPLQSSPRWSSALPLWVMAPNPIPTARPSARRFASRPRAGCRRNRLARRAQVKADRMWREPPRHDKLSAVIGDRSTLLVWLHACRAAGGWFSYEIQGCRQRAYLRQ